MKLIVRNMQLGVLTVYLEPSTDELHLESQDVLTIIPKFDYVEPFEFHYHSEFIVIGVPRGQSADFYINGRDVETICSQFTW